MRFLLANPKTIANALAAQTQSHSPNQIPGMSPLVGGYSQFVAGHATSPGLPRPMVDFLAGSFGPMSPVIPMPIDVPTGESERAGPRRWQYPIGWNLPIGQPGSEGYKLAPFSVLRKAADSYSVVRACINIRRDEMAGLGWDVGATDDAQAATKGDKGAVKDQRERALTIINWFKRVDSNYYGFQSWFTAALEEQIVIDATSLYLAPTRVSGKGLFGSELSELQLLDGSSIRPLLNLSGATPRPPSPAYQQYLWGVPRAELNAVMTGEDLDEMRQDLRDVGIKGNIDPEQEYRADQLLYIPRIRRSHSPYGFSPVEQALIPITLGMSRQSYLLDFYQDGTIPGCYVIAGDQYVTPAQQRQLQDTLNAIAGDVAWKHRVIVLPPGSKTDPQKNMDGQWQADQMVSEQVAMILHIQPHEIGMVPGGRTSGLGGKGMAQQQANAVSEQRTEPDRKWWKETCFDWIIQHVFKQGDLEWKWIDFEEEEDDQKKAQADQAQLAAGKTSIDELRIEDGKDPWNFPLTQSPFIIAGAQVIPLDPSVTPPAPPAPPGGMPGIPGAAPGHPAVAALSTALQPEPGKDPNKPKNDPAAAILSDKKKDRKKGRNELADRFADNLKDAAKHPPAVQPAGQTQIAPTTSGGKGKPPSADAPRGAGTATAAPPPATATQPGKQPPSGAQAPQVAVPVVVVGDGKKKKAAEPEYVPQTVADLMKKKGDLSQDEFVQVVVADLSHQYPPKLTTWVIGLDWQYDDAVKVKNITGQPSSGVDPKIVAAIGLSMQAGAPFDPLILVEFPDSLMVANGNKRYLAAQEQDVKKVPAYIGTVTDANADEVLKAIKEMQDPKYQPSGPPPLDANVASREKSAELGVLRRYLRKGGDVTKFVTTVIDPEVMALLTSDITSMGREAALDRARDRVTGKSISLDAPLETGVVPFDLAGEPAKCTCGLTLDADGLCPTHGAATPPTKHQQADDMLKAVEAELIKRGVNPFDETLVKRDPDHQPAGTPQGGQFAPTSSGSSSVTTGQDQYPTPPSSGPTHNGMGNDQGFYDSVVTTPPAKPEEPAKPAKPAPTAKPRVKRPVAKPKAPVKKPAAPKKPKAPAKPKVPKPPKFIRPPRKKTPKKPGGTVARHLLDSRWKSEDGDALVTSDPSEKRGELMVELVAAITALSERPTIINVHPPEAAKTAKRIVRDDLGRITGMEDIDGTSGVRAHRPDDE